MAKIVCTWVNTNINLCRLVGITSVLCSATNENMVNLYYNDGHIAKDILGQTDHLVLTYEIFSMPKNVKNSWLVHNERIVGKIAEVKAADADAYSHATMEDPAAVVKNIWIIQRQL